MRNFHPAAPVPAATERRKGPLELLIVAVTWAFFFLLVVWTAVDLLQDENVLGTAPFARGPLGGLVTLFLANRLAASSLVALAISICLTVGGYLPGARLPGKRNALVLLVMMVIWTFLLFAVTAFLAGIFFGFCHELPQGGKALPFSTSDASLSAVIRSLAWGSLALSALLTALGALPGTRP